MSETKSVRIKGYAKINLHLDVTGRMNDGYHRVETVMQTVSLCDTVELNMTDTEGITVSCNVDGVPLDGRNLAVRAAQLFCDTVGIMPCLHIAIDKQIPMAGGMAGGSADGAATLLGMNTLWNHPLTAEELLTLGAKLGADVPFCIFGGTALATGKGERLEEFPPMPDCTIVVACEGEGVSTPWAYGLLDTLYGNFEGDRAPRGVSQLRATVESGDLLKTAGALYNIFEEPILAERPVAARIRDLLLERGALGAMMSGSGPSVFGIFARDEEAQAAADALRTCGYRAHLCAPVGKR